MKNKKYHTVRTVPKSNRTIIERDKINTLYTKIHDRPPFWLVLRISIINSK